MFEQLLSDLVESATILFRNAFYFVLIVCGVCALLILLQSGGGDDEGGRL